MGDSTTVNGGCATASITAASTNKKQLRGRRMLVLTHGGKEQRLGHPSPRQCLLCFHRLGSRNRTGGWGYKSQNPLTVIHFFQLGILLKFPQPFQIVNARKSLSVREHPC